MDAIKESLKGMDIENYFSEFYTSMQNLCKEKKVEMPIPKDVARIYYIAGASHIVVLLNKIRKDIENAKKSVSK